MTKAYYFSLITRCVCCPTETRDSEDIKLRAILDRLDNMEARLVDQAESEDVSESERHVRFSEAADLFEGVRERSKNTIFPSFANLSFRHLY